MNKLAMDKRAIHNWKKIEEMDDWTISQLANG